MNLVRLMQTVVFRLRFQAPVRPLLRKMMWQIQGAHFGRNTGVPRMTMTWPHQVSIGRNCILEDDIFFKFADSWRPGPSIRIGNNVFVGRGCEFNICHSLRVGDDCLIGSGCKFIDAKHGTIVSDEPMNRQSRSSAPIILEEDVWLGVNVVVLKGVVIGRGAIVGAGAIVTKSVPPCEIWAGIPACKIAQRH